MSLDALSDMPTAHINATEMHQTSHPFIAAVVVIIKAPARRA